MKLKMKSDGAGQKSGKTVRRFNYKNRQALGRDAVEKMVDAGVIKTLDTNNFHKKLGGTCKEPKYRRKSNTHAALEDEMAFEDELWEQD